MTAVMRMEDSHENTNKLPFHFYSTSQDCKLLLVKSLLFEVTPCQLSHFMLMQLLQ